MTRWFAVALALMLAAGIAPASGQVGRTVQWADVTLHDGRVLRAAELTGKTVVVEFWATWCPFCKKQNPYVERLHREHGGQDLVVLTISIDPKPQAVGEYLKKYGYTFPVLMAGAQTQSWFPERKGLPVVYVIDPRGRVVFHEAGEMFEEDILGLVRFAGK